MRDKGAHFQRCDFQIHTPRDNQWKGSRPSPVDRAEYARSLVAGCRSAGLNAVAITDHHDFEYVPYIRRAAAEEAGPDGETFTPEERLVVFPGLELTLGVPCQALLILDADIPEERLPDVLNALSIEEVDHEEDALPSVTRLDHIDTLQKLHDFLHLKEYLRGRYIILPNVTEKGHGTLMRTGMANKYRDMPCVGGYLDGTVEKKVGEGNRRIFAGQDKARGHKRLALFQTSDMRRGDFTGLGEPSTWVKWATPTAEALRQACLAEESRISHTAPSTPTAVITRLSVSNSMFMGPVELALNPQYNAIIGGRGTGKSTLLDYLRWALCDSQAGLPESDETGDPAGRRRRLIETTLAPLDSTVDVHLEVNGIPHVVRRHAATGDLDLKISDGEFQRARETEVRELLPIQGYSQKQLSSVAVKLDELTRFVTAPIRRELGEIDRNIAESAGKVRETYSTVQRFRSLDASIQRLTLLERSLAEQAANLRDSLPTVSEEDRAVLASKPAYDGARAVHDQITEGAAQALRIAERLNEVIRQVIDGLPEIPVTPGEVAGPLRAEADAVKGVLQTFADAAAATTAEIQAASTGDIAEGRASVESILSSFDDKYSDVKARSTAHEGRLKELAEVERQQAETTRQLQVQRRELDALGDPQATMSDQLSNLFSMYTRRSSVLAEQCDDLSRSSEGLLRATLHRGQGLGAVHDALKAAVAGSNLRGARVETFFDALRDDSNPLATWQLVLDELELLAQGDADEPVTTEMAPNCGRLGFPGADLLRIRSKLTPDGWLLLALTRIDDHPVFEYQRRDGEFIAFADASAGQQATALMRVLLGQPGPPLVIDQPEDDLDSQVVLDVVERIWAAKKHRQLIFSSHNANLVVNGDAELVVCCDYRVSGDQSGGKIKLEGAIDMTFVRKEITRVMEGGERAFRLRKEKYGF